MLFISSEQRSEKIWYRCLYIIILSALPLNIWVLSYGANWRSIWSIPQTLETVSQILTLYTNHSSWVNAVTVSTVLIRSTANITSDEWLNKTTAKHASIFSFFYFVSSGTVLIDVYDGQMNDEYDDLTDDWRFRRLYRRTVIWKQPINFMILNMTNYLHALFEYMYRLQTIDNNG